MAPATLIDLIKQYAFRPTEGFDPSLADIAIIVGSMTAAILVGILISSHRRAKNAGFRPQ